MSENDPTPSKQTSSIPLKKETVRVTLKAADAPLAGPAPSIPTAPAVRPPTPTAPPIAGAPSAPPVPTAPGAPRPAPAPTIPLKTTGAPTAPKPAPTIRLSPAPGAPASPTAPAARPSLPGAAPAGGSTISLPKATVQLQPPSAATGVGALPTQTYVSGGDEDEDDGAESGLVGALSIVGFIAALVVLFFQLQTADAWVNAEDKQPQGWGNLFQ